MISSELNENENRFGAVIAAAGKSSRMGKAKQLLPWGESTVIETVVNNLAVAGVKPIICIVGRSGELVAERLSGIDTVVLPNPDYQSTEMVYSFQIGLNYMLHQARPVAVEEGSRKQQEEITLSGASGANYPIEGTFLSLGDQPHISLDVIQQILCQVRLTPDRIVIPSHKKRRGHPFYLPRQLWPDVLALDAAHSLRTVISRHSGMITYVNLNTDSILFDVDTPQDYARLRKRWDSTRCL